MQNKLSSGLFNPPYQLRRMHKINLVCKCLVFKKVICTKPCNVCILLHEGRRQQTTKEAVKWGEDKMNNCQHIANCMAFIARINESIVAEYEV